jgi:hypothetical protein
MTTLALDKRVPATARRALEQLDGVDVVPAPQSAIITEHEVTSLDVRTIGVDELFDEDAAVPALLLVTGVLDEDHAIQLEDLGQPFVDAAGRAWVPGAPHTARARVAGHGQLRPATMRAAQLLADHPNIAWSGPRLAERADVAQPTASRLLRQLLDAGLLTRSGAGRSSVTIVADVVALRRWLAGIEQGRQTTLACYVRNPEAIPASIDGHRLVRSGAHGAGLLGVPVISGAPRTMLRVHTTSEELEQIPGGLHGVRGSRAANVLLVADPERLGSLDARRIGDVWVAPPSRLCLDMKLEPRGYAAAGVFLDLWNNRIL